MQGLGARFGLEAGFLIALAIGVGIADLSAAAIVAVMAVAWLVVCLFELALWAEGPSASPAQRRTVEVEEPDELTPRETVEPAAITEIREPEVEARPWRFWRRRRAASGGA